MNYHVVKRVSLLTAWTVLTVLLNSWLEMVYISHACIPLLAVQHSSAVHFLRLIYVILDVLLEG